jgi:hypothetical protein
MSVSPRPVPRGSGKKHASPDGAIAAKFPSIVPVKRGSQELALRRSPAPSSGHADAHGGRSQRFRRRRA